MRLGRMAYVNTLPVDWGLAQGYLGSLVKITRGTPTQLNRLLAEGRLDVSPVSSVSAARHRADWLVLDHLCIGCRGAVGSVILISDRPVEKLGGLAIAVTRASATAAKLLEVLLERYWRTTAVLVPEEAPAPARLLIGDAALKGSQDPNARHVYDLGQEWRNLTGGDFVFGLWCARRDFVRDHPDAAGAIYHLLAASHALGRLDPEGVVAEAARVTDLSLPVLKAYFPKLVYQLDPGLWAGLTQFLTWLGYPAQELERYGA